MTVKCIKQSEMKVKTCEKGNENDQDGEMCTAIRESTCFVCT